MGENNEGVFISYRRDETTAYAGWLGDKLADHFGRQNVFRDLGSIEPGMDFIEAIERALEACAVMLVVIGRSWTTILAEYGRTGQEDYTRLEVATALKSDDVLVIPVLVQGASMPRADEVPADLVALTRRNARELHDSNWDSDVQYLITFLESVVGRGEEGDVAHGTIRVIRQAAEVLEWSRTINLLVDGEEIGYLAPKQTVVLDVEPGPHHLEVRCPPSYEDLEVNRQDRLTKASFYLTSILGYMYPTPAHPGAGILGKKAGIIVHTYDGGELINVLCGFMVNEKNVLLGGGQKSALFIRQL